MFIMYGMWYFEKLSKHCVYGFQFMFQVLLVRRGRARDDCREHTTLLRVLRFTMTFYDVMKL